MRANQKGALFGFALIVIIPRVNSPSNGPPTTPNIVKDACKTPGPRYSTINVRIMQLRPNIMAKIFSNSVSYSTLMVKNGFMKSSMVTAAKELIADETVLKDPENMPEINNPDNP